MLIFDSSAQNNKMVSNNTKMEKNRIACAWTGKKNEQLHHEMKSIKEY